MDLNEKRKEFIKNNIAEQKNWKQPFESEIFGPIFKIISIISSFIIARYLNILLLVIFICLIAREWDIAIIVISIYIFVSLIKYGIKWFNKNYKNIRQSTTSDGVTFFKLEKEGSVNNDINVDRPSLPFK